MTDASPRRARKRERTRREILLAAGRLVAQQDFTQLSVSAICEEADVARATFFLHFNYKPSLLLAWESGLLQDMEAALEAVRPRVAAVYGAMVDVFWKDPGVSRAVIQAALATGAAGPLLERMRAELERLEALGELRRTAVPALAARVLLGGIGAALGTQEGRGGSEALRDEVLSLSLSGVAESKPRLKWSGLPTAGTSPAV